MRDRKRLLLWSVGALVVIGGGVAVFQFGLLAGSGADWLVGSWDGQGHARTAMQGAIGKEDFNLPLTLNCVVKATFHKDQALAYSFRSESKDFNFSFEVPDSKGTGYAPNWELVRSGRQSLVVRLNLFGPGGPQYEVTFRNRDEFTMTPVDTSKGADTLIFRRTAASK